MILQIPDATNWIYDAIVLGNTKTRNPRGSDLMPSNGASGRNVKMSRGKVPLNVLALDSGASVSILINSDYITNMKQADKPITIQCGGKSWKETQTGELRGDLLKLPLCKTGYFFNQDGVANLLSLSQLSDEYDIVMDTRIDNAFYVFNNNGNYIRFARSNKTGLYVLEVQDTVDPITLSTTVKEEKNNFSKIGRAHV
mgnify:CR=1 FL=1